MMDIGQFLARDRERVSGLFEKLADTSEGAVKTRERLFERLKTELDAHTAAVEEVLYPVLKRHPETKDLVPAQKELNEVDRTLQALDRMPKDDDDFLKTLRDLERTVEREMREEEKKIAPALKRALDADEIEEIARELATRKREEQQQDAAAAGGAASWQGAKPQRKEDADQEEQTEAANRAAVEGLRVVAERGAGIARQGGEAAAEGARRLAESVFGQAQQAGRGFVEAAQAYSEMAQRALEGLQALADSSRLGADGVRRVQQMWLERVDTTVRRGRETSQELLRCASPQQAAEVQRRFVEESVNAWLQGSAEMLRLSTRLMEQMAEPIEASARRFPQEGRGEPPR